MIPGITEEEEEEEEQEGEVEEEMEIEEVDQFGPELHLPGETGVIASNDDHSPITSEPLSPLSALPSHEENVKETEEAAKAVSLRTASGGSMPLTEEALARMNREEGEEDMHVPSASSG